MTVATAPPALASRVADVSRRAQAAADALGRPVIAELWLPYDDVDPIAWLALEADRSDEDAPVRIWPPEAADPTLGPERAYWREAGRCWAAVGAVVRLEARGAARVAMLQRARDEAARAAVVDGDGPADAPRWLGGLAFAAGAGWDGFPDGLLWRPALTLVRDDEGTHLLLADVARPGRPAAELAERLTWLRAAADERRDRPAPPDARPAPAAGPSLDADPAYEAGVAGALERIAEGALDKIVLARRVEAPLVAPLPELLGALERRFPGCTTFLLAPAAGRALVGATPERLIALADGELRTAALAGTAPRAGDPAEDAARARALRDSPKERREHALVVDALRAGLAPFARGPVVVSDAPQIERLDNVMHLATPMTAAAGPDVDLLEVVDALHPTPAVGGWPRDAALADIARRETAPRGWYAGPVGWLADSGEGAFCVALRCALLDWHAGRAELYAGAGVVEGSTPSGELAETREKLRAMAELLG